jgi:enoyl-CoA hydratase/carnithine racemase
MIPGVGGTQTLSRLLGVTRAVDAALTGNGLDAFAAQRLGLVARVVAPARLLGAALALARRVARLDHALVVQLKRGVSDGLDRSLEQGLVLERRTAVIAGRAQRRERLERTL